MTCRGRDSRKRKKREGFRDGQINGSRSFRTSYTSVKIRCNWSNIANVNTWGFKSSSFNFTDAMYSTSIAGASGSVLGGGGPVERMHHKLVMVLGTGSIQASFGQGAMSPSGNSLDCMIELQDFSL